MVALAVNSLSDKSHSVRRSCIKTLVKLITTHPYNRLHDGALDLDEWQNRHDLLSAQASKFQNSSDFLNKENGIVTEDNKENVNVDDINLIQNKTSDDINMFETEIADFEGRILISNDSQDSANELLNYDEMSKCRFMLKYYSEAIQFIRYLDEASEKILDILGSRNKSEVIDSMDFFVITDTYKLRFAKVCFV